MLDRRVQDKVNSVNGAWFDLAAAVQPGRFAGLDCILALPYHKFPAETSIPR